MSSQPSGTPSRPIRTRQPVKNPGMVSPCVDSRRRLSVEVDPPTMSKKRKDRTYEPSPADEDSDASIISIHPSPAGLSHKEKSKVTGPRSQPGKKAAPAGPANDVSFSYLHHHALSARLFTD
ncbi:uncharacterized protein MELLADRAFT_66512 [Melampsora larici-populina 98AG31]|uniref:Uncharacterized protein n=1 Tax=Melampsora larici-populina (strain 98AG31 / pathotype 3-4-7) TaxID=747676 RepID=F4RZI1_MELLP|nr:uncharacterized protein MELLADRAFT_66512 [Melampsora larici-populina 98AG31]EGG02251.1 hypothetical protein MELLADRAFT_66512 [Melampsora larici-populina 98AG31]